MNQFFERSQSVSEKVKSSVVSNLLMIQDFQNPSSCLFSLVSKYDNEMQQKKMCCELVSNQKQILTSKIQKVL